jgi:hypothetical protein
MQCSFIHRHLDLSLDPANSRTWVFIGSQNKLVMVDGATLEIIATLKLSRQIFSICADN